MKVAHLSEPAEERVIFRDGLGVREWRDTGTGERVEWLHLDAAFAGVELPLRDRVTRLAKLQHVKFARILNLEPARKGKGPVLVSSHVAGTRLSEVLEMASHGLVTFDPGSGLQVTRDVLAALAILHDSRNVTHGALGPERVVLTASGRVVMVEHVLAHALDRLKLPRHQLWRDWRIATPPAAGQVRFDIKTDIAQAGLLALAALLGRPLEAEEYPHRLRGLLPIVQDRLGTSPAAAIAGDVVAWLERLVPVDSRRPFGTVRQAQQAFEALVSGGAAAMGISLTRVKGVMGAVTAIGVSPEPVTEASPAAQVVAPGPVAEMAAVPDVLPSVTVDVSPRADDAPGSASEATDESAIDIEALLALEAELEGDDRSLQGLAQERTNLERQFASLVETVAPAASEPPVRLIPETPASSEPLVDERVRWSSMPAEADDLPAPDAAPADLAPAAVADDPHHSSVDADVAAADPMATDGGTEAFAFEPIVISVPEEPTPAAAIDHVPADWWREALPWRAGGDEARADAAVGTAEAVTGASRIVQDDVETRAEAPSVDIAVPAADAASALDDAGADGTAGHEHEHEQRGDDSSDARDAAGCDPALVADTDADAVASDVAPVAAQLADDDAESLPLQPEPVPAAFDVRFGSLTLESLELRASTIALEPTTEPAFVGEPDGVSATLDVEVAADGEAEVVEHTTANEFNEPDAPSALAAQVEAEAPAEPVAAAEHVVPGDPTESVEPGAHVEPTDAADAVAPVELLQGGADGPPVASLFDEAAASMEAVAADGPIDSIETGDAVGAYDAVSESEPHVHADATDASVVASDEAEGLDAVAATDAFEVPIPVVEATNACEPIEPAVDAVLFRPIGDASLGPLVAEVTGDAWDDEIDDAVMRVSGDTADVVQPIADAIPPAQPEQEADPASDVAASDTEPAVVVGDDAAEPAGLATLIEDDAPGDAVVESGTPLADSPHDDIGVAAAGEAPTSAFTEPQPRFDAEEAQDTSPAGGGVGTPHTAAASLLARLVEADEPTHRTSWRDALLADTADAAPPTSPVPAFFAEPPSDPAASGEPVPAAPSVPEEPPVAPEFVPEVVIVDGGSDASAWDHLPSEQPDAAQDAPAIQEALAASAATSGDAGAASGRKKRRRNRRRKGGAAQPPVAPAIAVPQVPVPMMVPVSQIPGMPGVIAYAPIPASMGSVPVIAPAIAAPMPLLGHQPGTSATATVEARSAIEAPAPAHQDIDDAGEQAGAAPARTRTLLDREVPTWTPPADLRAVHQRTLPMVPRESAGPLERAATAERDEEGGGMIPSRDATSELPTTPAIPADAGVRSTGAAGRAIAQASPPPVEPVLQFEQEIRAVGMPDLDEMAPRTTRAALTSMADAIGPVSPAPRQSKGDHWAAQPASRAPARGMNWRRLIAASVIVALFQGAAFAAWWWVQPGAYGTLVVQTAQPGVEVLIDGKVIGRTPLREEVVPGRHALTLRQGGNVRQMPVEISLGVVTTQALDWPAVDGVAMGNLQVTSTPTGAEVFIDGTSRGKAPVLLEDLRAGKHELTLRGDAGTVTVETTVIAGETTSLEVPIFAGWILVDSPLEVSLVLGRKKIGSSMDGQILMPPGTHRVQAVNEALGIRQSFTVRVEPGAVERVAIAVPASPLQLQDEVGTEVFVDGERIGTLPGALSIPVGTHDVRVRRPDGSERRQTVTVRQGEVVSM